jgi:NAD-specific glutamate dehydrogenase
VRETDPALLAAWKPRSPHLRTSRAAVEDWPKMPIDHEAVRQDCATRRPSWTTSAESGAFLEWLAADHFTLRWLPRVRVADGEIYDTLAPRANSGASATVRRHGDAIVRTDGQCARRRRRCSRHS